MVYGIVKQSGGEIKVDSEPNQGTKFKIFLPRAKNPRDEEPGPGAWDDVSGGTETILLVEDEEAIRSLTHFVLQQRGYTVIEASNGEEALQVVSQHRGSIHLLVTDVVMPRMGGRSLAESLQPLHPETKVLYLSGHTNDAVLRQGIGQAESAFLQKPFTMLDFARKVRDVLDKKG